MAIHARTSVDEGESLAREIRGQGTDVLVVQAAIENVAAVEAMIRETVDRFGRLDILVNAAAIWQPIPLEHITAEDLREYFEVNAMGGFIAARSAGLQMVTQPAGGAIINISDWALHRPYLDHAAYFQSKGAVEAMTRSLAVELAHRNPRVRVNCVQPGPVMLSADTDEATRRAIEESVLLRRIGTADEVAHAVEFLCENRFVTGVMLPVDGGKSIYANDGMQIGRNTG